MNHLLITLTGITCFMATSISCNPIVYINNSQIIGEYIDIYEVKVARYLGIPYAEPPVRNLRFMKTEPITVFPKTLDATQKPPACHQYSTLPYPWYANTTDKSENCLFLNIWTPADASPANNTKAVLFWIHGGSFRYGSIRQEVYSAEILAGSGDMVVVTVNYRLGVFGFLTSNTADAPGNAGLWDVLEGLRWVNRNIRAFGGHPNKITIAGESAGAMMVGMLSVSPLSRGLYAQQIMQSGAPTFLALDDREHNLNQSQRIGSLIGCTNDTYTIYDHPKEVIYCLKGVDAVTLGKLDMQMPTVTSVTFSPQFGDEILPTNPRIAIANGKFHPTKLFIGVNREEGSQLSTIFPNSFGFHGEKPPQMNKTTAKGFMRNLFEAFLPPAPLINHYLPDAISEYSYDGIQQQIFSSFGDELLACPTVYYAEKSAANGSDVFFYFWVHRPSNTPWKPRLGVAHFSEVQFVLGQPLRHPLWYDDYEVSLCSQMIGMWSSFVKHGSPGTSWPPYKKDAPIFKYLGSNGETPEQGMGPYRENCDFLRPYFGF